MLKSFHQHINTEIEILNRIFFCAAADHTGTDHQLARRSGFLSPGSVIQVLQIESMKK